MGFKEWLFNEAQWAIIDHPVMVNGIKCNRIDFRFEDYKKDKSDGDHWLQFNRGSFSAPLHNGQWLNYSELKKPNDDPDLDNMDLETWKKLKSQGKTLHFGGQPKCQINISDRPFYPEERHLPEDWYEYAAMFMGETLVSQPKYPRNDFEKIRHDVPLHPSKQSLPTRTVEPIFNT